MTSGEHVTEEQKALAATLAELHYWELKQMPLLHTMTGRSLYFRILQEALKAQIDNVGDQNPMEVFNNNHFTDRAMRVRMQSMCKEGLLEMVPAPNDGRIKHVLPTEKFFALGNAHAMQLRKLLEQRFIIVNK